MDHMDHNEKPHGGVILLAVVTALVLGGVFFSFRNGRVSYVAPVSQLLEQAESAGTGSQTQQYHASAQQADVRENVKGALDVSDVVKAAMPCIVSITGESVQVVEYFFYGRQEIPSESMGSGIIIGQSDSELLIATNYHVVEGADTLTVCFSAEAEKQEDTIAMAKLKGGDEEKDLAVVAVDLCDIDKEILAQIRVAVLGDSDEIRVGERAVAIGNALGYGQSVTAGIVSAVNREMTIGQTTQSYVQTDAAINEGNSGGALLNAKGEVIGINSAKAASTGTERMGYAIPINEAKPVLEELMLKETRDRVPEAERGSLGIRAEDVSEEARQIYDIPAGAFVYEIYAGSTAGQAGLQRGDIITEFDGNRIRSSDALENLLGYYRAGESVEIGYETNRGGSYQAETVTVILGEENTAVSGQSGNGPRSQISENGRSWYGFYGNW